MRTPWITTFTGKIVNPLDLKPEDICVEDIAHHLAILNRFVGATKKPVSIAQHSIYVSRLLDGTGWEGEGLFHDGAEAYLGDVSKWVKMADTMAAYRDAEDRAWSVICVALGLNPNGDPQTNAVVEEADRLMVRYEALKGLSDQHLFSASDRHPRPTVEEVIRIGPWRPWSWQDGERGFLDRARALGFLPTEIPARRGLGMTRKPGRKASATAGSEARK